MWGSYRAILQKYESTGSENVVLKGQSLLRGSFRWKFEWAGLRKCGLQGCVCVCMCVCVCGGDQPTNTCTRSAFEVLFFLSSPSLISFCKYVDNIY